LQTFSQKRTKKIFSAAAEASGSVFQKVSGRFFQRGFKEFQGDFFREGSASFREIFSGRFRELPISLSSLCPLLENSLSSP
jgi:hypothetical protein